MRGQYLSTSKKDRLKPFLLHRDGPTCLYCKEPLNPSHHDFQSKDLRTTFDHLDDNPRNNDESNIVLCHWKCNQLKKTYPEYKLIAQEKMKELDSLDPLYVSETTSPKPASKEIDLNVAAKKLTWEYLNDRLVNQGKPAINYNDAAHSISFIFWQRTGHGSSESIKRYLNDFTSSAAPFKALEENGETVIVKRV